MRLVLKQSIATAVKGILMGMAEVLPGISGGTVAYITRIYPQFIQALSSAIPRAISSAALRTWWVAFYGSWPFLIPLASGMLIGVATMVLLVNQLLTSYAAEIWGLIFGLMGGAVVQLAGDTTRRNLASFGVVGLVVGLLLTWLNLLSPVDSEPSLLLVFFGGFIAFSAWLVPGISGSMMLLILGVWSTIVESFASLAWTSIGVFLTGMACGLILIPGFIQTGLKKYQPQVVAIFTGLLLGSMLRVWPWQSDLGELSLPDLSVGLWELIRVCTLIACGFTVMMTVIFYERHKQTQ